MKGGYKTTFGDSLKLLLLTITFSSLCYQVYGQNDRELLQRRDPRVYSNYEIVDSEGKYEVEWVVNWDERRIVFDVTVETVGYIAFGLSAKEEIEGADIVIGGVARNGSAYFTDRYGVSDRIEPRIDLSQDWILHDFEETRTHTYLRFSRAFDTCNDEEDYPINEYDTVNLVWSYGQSDDPGLEWGRNENSLGFYPVNLLDPNLVPRSLKEASFRRGPPSRRILAEENLQLWTVTARSRLPPTETAYLCTMHQAPRLGRKHHIVGKHTRLETQEAYQHTHHLIFYQCFSPPNSTASEFFSRYLDAPAQSCNFLTRPMGQIPTNYCTRVMGGYGIGGRIFFYPDHVGLPFGEDLDEFYVLQVHYDNPDSRSDLEFDVNFDFYYTSELRNNDIAILTVGHQIPGSPSILIPPDTQSHYIFSHCGAQCTDRMIPPEGINVFNAGLHTHYAGRKARIRHIRGSNELPWIQEDSNWIPTYQTLRTLSDEKTILPGDHITMECEYDSTEANGTVVGGFSTRQEMCLAYVLYYSPLDDYFLCRSEIVDSFYMRKYLGVTNITWSQEKLDMVATSPSSLAGLSMAEISDTRVRWTDLLRSELKYDHRNLPQENSCASTPISSGQGQLGVDEATFNVTFPNIVSEWSPPERTCASGGQIIGKYTNTIVVGRNDLDNQALFGGNVKRPKENKGGDERDLGGNKPGSGWKKVEEIEVASTQQPPSIYYKFK